MTIFLSLFSAGSFCQCGSFFIFFPTRSLQLNFVTLKCACHGGGAPLVRSNPVIWSCPAGYRPSYFMLEGGKGVWRSIRESQAPQLCSSAPRALAKDRWSVRNQSCLLDQSASPSWCRGASPHAFHVQKSVLTLRFTISQSFWYLLTCPAVYLHIKLILQCLKAVEVVSSRQLTHYLCSTTCARCWIRKTVWCAAAAMTSLFQICGDF